MLWGNLPLTFFFWGIPLYLGAFRPPSLILPLEKPSPLSSSLLFPLGNPPLEIKEVADRPRLLPFFLLWGNPPPCLDFLRLSLLSSFRPAAFALVRGRSEEIGSALPFVFPLIFMLWGNLPLIVVPFCILWGMLPFQSRKFPIGTEGKSRPIG